MATASTKRRALTTAPHILFRQRARALISTGLYSSNGVKGTTPVHRPFARAMLHVVLSRLPDSAVRMELIHPDVMRLAVSACHAASANEVYGGFARSVWAKSSTTDERGRTAIRALAQNDEKARDRALALTTTDLLLRLADNAHRQWASSLPKAIKSIQALGLMTDDELRALIATCA